MHSNASDGVYSPSQVVQMAFDNGARVVSLTDHDTVAGLAQARKKAQALGMRFIDGVEMSVSWGDKTIHVVSLGFKDPQPYVQLAQNISQMRERRARAMAA